MVRFFKKGKVISQSLRTKKLCPHCGNDEFALAEGGMSWLFGQKFVCSKCKGTFKNANVVKVHEKSREFQVNQTGTSHKSHRHKPKHKKH